VERVGTRRAARTVHRARGAVSGVRLLAGGRTRTPGAIVLAYHDVVEGNAPPNFYAVTAAELRCDLDALARWGLTVVSLPELVSRLCTGSPIDGLVAITFDDGLAGLPRVALPLLADAGVTATVFAPSAVLGRDPEWWAESGPLMDVDELRALVAAGWSVGSHTRTHPSLPDLTDGELASELAGSRDELSGITGSPVDLLAYPFGHVDERIVDAARAAGYRAGFAFVAGRITPTVDHFRIPRLPVHAGRNRRRLAYEVARPADSWPDTANARPYG
jgi:peptidoglycan/xylan/chitin deacetylase (PgdA/CDA1 family)